MIIGLVGTEGTRKSIETRLGDLDTGFMLIALDDMQEGNRLDKTLWEEVAKSRHVVGVTHITNRLHAHQIRTGNGFIWHVLGKPSSIIPMMPDDLKIGLHETTRKGHFNCADGFAETLRLHWQKKA